MPQHLQVEERSPLAALTRFAFKYGQERRLIDFILRRRSYCTEKLVDWMTWTGDRNNWVIICPEDVIEATNLFRLIDRTEFLPAAVYLRTRLSPRDFLQGIQRADGTPEALSPHDQEAVWRLQQGFYRRDTEIVARAYDILPGSACRCPTSSRCDRIAREWLEKCRAQNRLLVNGDPLRKELQAHFDVLGLKRWVYEPCTEDVWAHVREMQRAVWDDLLKPVEPHLATS